VSRMARSARALVVELVADVGDFVKGTQKADDALSDFVRDADGDLDKLERQSRDAADGMERAFDSVSFDKMAAESKTATDKMERNFDNLAREAKRSFDKVEREARDVDLSGAKQSFGEAGSEVGSEFAQNLGESLSSGDLTSLAQDTAGGLIGAFQGLGPGIGTALAGVAAVATTVFAKMSAEAQASAERIRTLTSTIFDELNKDMDETLSKMMRGDAWKDFQAGFSPSGDVNEGMTKMRAIADKIGISVGDIATAFIQGGPAQTAMKARIDAVAKAGQGAVKNVRGVGAASTAAANAANELRKHFQEADQATRNAEANLAAQFDTLIKLNAKAAQYERNLQAANKQAGNLKNNLVGAAGTVVGGRAVL
jgi:hypothetical protein